MPKKPDLSGKSFGSVQFLLIVLVIGIVLYGVYLTYSIANVNGQIAAQDQEVKQAEEQLQVLENENVIELVNAKKALALIEQTDVAWSEMLTSLLDATPDDIVYRSYSGNDNGTVTMSVIAPSFERVADLVNILNSKPFISSAFVPSIVKGTTPTNAAIYSFSLNIEYEQQ